MKQQYIQVFKNKNFMKLFIADIISRFGDSLDAIVMTIIVYSITQSASWSALILSLIHIQMCIRDSYTVEYLARQVHSAKFYTTKSEKQDENE